MTINGTEKSAILMVTIGEDRAVEVFKHLSPREVQQISGAMANLHQISTKQLADVLNEFEDDSEQYASLSVNTSELFLFLPTKSMKPV